MQRRNHTRELISLPKSNKLVGFTWLFKLTRNEEGKIMEHKARVVAQGYAQRFGDDFEEVYAPLTRHATLQDNGKYQNDTVEARRLFFRGGVRG